MGKIGRAAQDSGVFSATHLVGVGTGLEPAEEDLGAGLLVVRLPARKFSGGTLGRVLRVAVWYSRVLGRYGREPVSLIAAHSVWVLPLCWVLSKRTGSKLIYNAHELETETISMFGMKKKIAQRIEALLIGRCAVVSVVNEPIAEWYEHRYGMSRPVVVGNTPVMVDSHEGLRERLGVGPDPLLFIHTGHLVVGRNIPLILKAFHGSPHHLVFLGDGPYKDDIVKAGQRSPNIHWLPPVPHDRIVSNVREADVGLCLIEIHQDLSDQLSSPNKLLESLAAGIPALCTDLVEARRLMGELAEGWILSDPETELSTVLETIDRSRVTVFKQAWGGLPSWDEEVASWVQAITGVVGPSAPPRGVMPHEVDLRQD
ncbi:MAG TPA: glycosyltransferase [Nocardioides sp.]|nr:glycosyltransferase [Nocardioides sp.]